MPGTILVVDDSVTLRALVRTALEEDHHHVVEAASGREALAALDTTTADLVITDVNMPEMDGLTLVRTVRQRPRERSVPILVLTTEDGDDMKQRGREAGATGWIVKPFHAERLRDVVRRVLRTRPTSAGGR
jgi:two-component system, chemotaxis family, chemotaxis protein CheY